MLSNIEEDFAQLWNEFGEVQTVVKNSGNLAKKNTKLWDLKEPAEGDKLIHYLQDLFTRCVESCSELQLVLL